MSKPVLFHHAKMVCSLAFAFGSIQNDNQLACLWLSYQIAYLLSISRAQAGGERGVDVEGSRKIEVTTTVTVQHQGQDESEL